MIRRHEAGGIHGSTLAIIGMTILFAAAGTMAIWAFVEYTKARDDVQGQISTAVATAKKEQADEDETKFEAREKEPNRLFVGPNDYGRVTFSYPKTWSVYEATDVSNGGEYKAYFNPITVPPINSNTLVALRVTIVDDEIDKVQARYSSQIKKGELNVTTFSTNSHDGIRIDGQFTKDIRGSLVAFKIRDKALVVQTDSEAFKADYDKLIATINFNQ